MASDDDHRRKSRKHDDSGRSKRRSSRDRDRRHRDEDRHSRRSRDRDSGRREDRDGGGGGSRDRKKSSRGKGDGDRGRAGDRTLTEEEEKLYAKAREYVKREGKDGSRRRQKDDLRGGRGGKRRRSDSEDSTDSASREGRRHRSHGRDHKRSSRNKRDGDRGESSRHKKKSKHDHHREEKKGRRKDKEKHGSKKTEKSFKDKASLTINPANLMSLGDVVRKPPAEKLDPETNYFSHNSHLRLFLYRQFGIYFEDLTSTESHEAFKEFTHSYNAGRLEGAYYASGLLPQEALDQCSRTKHQWKFRTNRAEEQSLETVRAGVKKQTEYSDKSRAATVTGKREAAFPITRMQNDRKGADAAPQERRRRTPQEMAAQRQSDKQHRDRIKLANEEIHGVGRADPGRERTLEKRRERSEKIHGAARDRDGEAYGGVELDDDAIYGGGGGGRKGEATYEEALARERQRRERREAEKAARTRELLQKEEEKKKKMLEMIGLSGLKPGQKIKIAPRNDGA